MINQWFPNVTDLSILFEASYPPKSFPSVLDLTKVMKLSLQLGLSTSPTPSELGCIISLLKRTPNIQSLSIDGVSFIQRDPSSIEKVYSIINRHVDWSKLRHVEVPICNLHHVQMLSNRFRNLCSIRFHFNVESLSAEQLINVVKVLMPACSIGYDYSVVYIWTGERPEKNAGF